MVVLVDLDDDPHDGASATTDAFMGNRDFLPRVGGNPQVANESGTERPNPNINGFSAALSCYPIVSQLASQLDLNSLHDLSRTCRQFRANLLQYRNQLVTQTLHCSNEQAPLTDSPLDHPAVQTSPTSGGSNGNGLYSSRLPSSARMGHKAGKCARDMVGECRRCGIIVCRNCTTKSLPTQALKDRHRRLCATCTNAPLALLTTNHDPSNHPASSSSDLWHHPSESGPALAMGNTSSPPLNASPFDAPSQKRPPGVVANEPRTNTPDLTSSSAFTSSAFDRDPCNCADAFWICQPCGHGMRSADTTYMRGWTWRTKYTAYLGGLGTGVGEGNEGVPCGRGPRCLAARVVEHEVDFCIDSFSATVQSEWDFVNRAFTSSAMTGSTPASGLHASSAGSTSSFTSDIASTSSSSNGRSENHTLLTTTPSRPSYKRATTSGWNIQECEGIGGVMRKKCKKLVRVGAVVREFEDEREPSDASVGTGGSSATCISNVNFSATNHADSAVTVLGREKRGERRSWCAWCERVIPGIRDCSQGVNSTSKAIFQNDRPRGLADEKSENK